MSRVSEAFAQTVVQPVFGVVETCGDFEAQLDEPGATDRDEQGLVAHDVLREVAEPCFDEIATGQCEQFSGHVPQGTCAVD